MSVELKAMRVSQSPSTTMDMETYTNGIPKSGAMIADEKSSFISIHNLNYYVEIKKEGSCCGKWEKHILKDVNGIFKPGLNAIMGPTGSGKSSLLDILAGRKNPKGLHGSVLVDGLMQPTNFKCMAGYVVQDDVVMGTLTVRENFMFSANLRLREHLNAKQKVERVEETIQELGLVHCADTKVGTAFIRGVSGGERKRCNIGMELIIRPPVLFLDEPTTGLDSSTANAVILLLDELAKKGKTIILSIHQPRYSIFKCFDNLMLLSLGKTVYHGPSDGALTHFHSLGYEIEEHNNPPDFFLDIINGDSSALQHLKAKSNGSSTSMTKLRPDTDVEVGVDAMEHHDDDATLADTLNARYVKSQYFASVMEEITPVFNEYKRKVEAGRQKAAEQGNYASGFWTQMNWLSKRTVLNLVRNPQVTYTQIGVSVVFALIVGIVYWQVPSDNPAAIQDRVGAFFFIIMNQVFSNLSAVQLFMQEKAIFVHENTGGFYRVSTFFFSKLICDMLPMRAVPVIIYTCITYFMVGLIMDAGHFFFYMLDLFLTTFAASSIGFLVSACFDQFAIANLAMALIFVLMMVFGGLLVNLAAMADWLSWLQYLSIFRYSLDALMISQMWNLVTCDPYDYNGTTYENCDNTTANQYLTNRGITYENPWDLWENEVALFIMAVVFIILTYIRLVTMNKFK